MTEHEQLSELADKVFDITQDETRKIVKGNDPIHYYSCLLSVLSTQMLSVIAYLSEDEKSLEDARLIIDGFKSQTLNILSMKGWE